MQATRLAIPEVVLFTPNFFGDERGFFFESFNQNAFEEATGIKRTFIQDNHSKSQRGVLRGLHYQLDPMAQGKLVRVTQGAVLDVAVDLRRSSPTFGKSVAVELNAENGNMLWIPPGFGHAFLALEDQTGFAYKVTDYYSPRGERTILWSDAEIGIDWPVNPAQVIVSDKDRAGRLLKDADVFA